MIKDPVLNSVTFLMLPFIIVFALYIQFHADYTPGGGFQTGKIIASGIILAAFTPRKYSSYSFLLQAESTPGP
jgi:multisubunit Na+/H+ antiporter MnhB subunit